MQILQLRKHDKYCHECGNEINRLDFYVIADSKVMHPYCAKIRRLHSGVKWWVKRNFIQ